MKKLLLQCAVALVAVARAEFVIGPSEDWIPVKSDAWIAPGSALDFSALRPTDGPAGAYGRVVARDGHFEFADRPGVPQRFYGVNVCGNANVVDREAARRFAANLARVGYNAVRLMHLDPLMDKSDPAGLKFDEKALDRFDCFVSECIRHGLYLTMDLSCFRRPVSWRSIGIDRDGDVKGETGEAPPVYTVDAYRENFKAYVRNLLGHVNAYTGRRYADESAFIWIGYLNEPYSPQGYKQEKWASMLSGERRFAREITALIRNELKSTVMTANMNGLWFPAFLQVPRAEEYDVVDSHYYIEHPEFTGEEWKSPIRVKNEETFRMPKQGSLSTALHRDARKPYVVSEWNACAPSSSRMASSLAFVTYAALQDWSGLWRFDWCWDDHGAYWPNVIGVSWFAMCGDAMRLATERAGVALFARRDIDALSTRWCATLGAGDPDVRNPIWGTTMWNGRVSPLGWKVRLASAAGQTPPDGWRHLGTFPEAFTNDTATLQAMVDPEKEHVPVLVNSEKNVFAFSTPRFCAVVLSNGVQRAGALRVEVSGAPATVYAMSLSHEPIPSANRILLAHLTDVQNDGVVYQDETRSVCVRGGNGRKPQLARAGKAQIQLRVAAGSWRVFALYTNGKRRCEIPSSCEEGELTFLADIARDPSEAMFQYEIVRDAVPRTHGAVTKKAIMELCEATARSIAAKQAVLKDSCSLDNYAPVILPDGTKTWADALQRALDEHEVVHIPSGTWVVEKTVCLPSNRRIVAASNACIKAAKAFDPRGFLVRNRPGADNIGVTGGIWEDCVRTRQHRTVYGDSSTMFRFKDCTNLSVTDLTVVRSAVFSMQFGQVTNLWVENIRVRDSGADGVHLNGNVSNALVRRIRGNAGDDLVALNAWDWWWPEKRIGSTESFGPLRNVFVDDVQPDPGSYQVLRLLPGIRTVNGVRTECPIERVVLRNIRVINRFVMVMQRGGSGAINDMGRMDDIYFDSVTVSLRGKAFGWGVKAEDPPERRHTAPFWICSDVGYLSLENVTAEIESEAGEYGHLVTVGPWIQSAGDCPKLEHLHLDNIRYIGAPPSEVAHAVAFGKPGRAGVGRIVRITGENRK